MSDHADTTIERRNEVQREAERDILTGVGSRLAYDRASKTIERKDNLADAIVLLKISNISEIRDMYGDDEVNQLVLTSAHVIRRTAQKIYVPERIFRIEDDLFAAIIPTGKADAYIEGVLELFNLAVAEMDILGIELSLRWAYASMGQGQVTKFERAYTELISTEIG